MLLATLELAKYLAKENIPVVGDPYVEFNDTAVSEPLDFTGASTSFAPLLGVVTLYRFSNRRWLVQWFQIGAEQKRPTIRAQEVVDLLESVIAENRKSLEGVACPTSPST